MCVHNFVLCNYHVCTHTRCLVVLMNRRVSISILRVCPACGPAVKEHVLTPALVLSTSPLLQDTALDSLLAFLEQMVISDAIAFQELLSLLRSRAESEEKLSKLALSSLAKGIAVITAATTPENREEVVSDLLSSLEGADDAMDDAGTRQIVLSLRVSGDLGRVVDYSSMDGVAERLQAIYLGSFDSSSEEIKQAAAYALGVLPWELSLYCCLRLSMRSRRTIRRSSTFCCRLSASLSSVTSSQAVMLLFRAYR